MESDEASSRYLKKFIRYRRTKRLAPYEPIQQARSRGSTMQQFETSSRAHNTDNIRQSNVTAIVVYWHRHQAVEHLLCWHSHCVPAYLHVLNLPTRWVGRQARPSGNRMIDKIFRNIRRELYERGRHSRYKADQMPCNRKNGAIRG
jgi:hypothetical protein